jgi:tetratricopeptide (TPR) repeat protein
MAYNPFYPPELGHIEKRNASPDRSHNETWDALVISGAFGLIAYLGVFGAVFYFGLKWLGLIASKQQHNLFWSLFIGGGVVVALGFVFWQEAGFIGVGLPFGIFLGILLYLTLIALFFPESLSDLTRNNYRDLSLIIFLSAITAHFVEINFGIAIVATRTYFWVIAALLLSVGTLIPKEEISVSITNPQSTDRRSNQKRRRRQSKSRSASRDERSKGLRDIFIGTGITGLFLITLNYEFIANLTGSTSAIEILWSSLTRVQGDTLSYGVLALIITAWLSASVVFASESTKYNENSNLWRSLGGILGFSALIGLIYGFWLSGSLASLARIAPTNQNEVIQQVAGFEGLLTQFYTFIILSLLVLATVLPKEWPIKTTSSILGPFSATVLLILVIIIANFTNLRIIRADITFKMAEPFGNSNQWPVAILLYQRARELAPEEDYYYLFLGRAYLEYAKGLTDQQIKRDIFNQAEIDLSQAQMINPLNPDHTANLARLYSWWALQADNSEARINRGLESDKYYARATVLSPNNARLWNEWAILHLNILNQNERANDLLLHSLEIDSQYDWTNALLGDYYVQIARQTDNPALSSEYFEKAAYHYDQAITWATGKTLSSRQGLNYFFALASVYQGIDDIENTIATLEASLEHATNRDDIWKIEENLVQFYLQLNERENAIIHARKAFEFAPDPEKARISDLISQLENSLP